MMNWDKLLSAKRLSASNQSVLNKDYARSQFQRDYDRLIFSSPFRRLQNKTQVFPLPGAVFVHNRLTHSLEVASVGRSLGNKLGLWLMNDPKIEHKELLHEIGSIVSSACLAHDMGNPPFGHSGEEAISNYFKTKGQSLKEKLSESEWCDITNFEGNANAFRILTHQFKGRRKGGFGLTYSSLLSIVKYPYESIEKKKKYGFFQSEKEIYKQLADETGIPYSETEGIISVRHPLVYLVEAADDICYQVMDTEDAHKLGILGTQETIDLFLNFFKGEDSEDQIKETMQTVSDVNEQISYLRAMVINLLVTKCIEIFQDNHEKILEGQFEGSLIKHLRGYTQIAMKECKKIAVSRIYAHKSVLEIELAGYKILGTLLENFVEAALYPEDDYNEKLLRLMPQQYDWQQEGTYEKIQAVLDFISGMTDVYALDLYRKITGITLPGIK